MATAAIPQAAPAVLPRHVAIIMDGNGRWAAARRLPRAMGHRAGVEAVRTVTRAARAMGIEALTLYAFSSENWRRPAEEIGGLMKLLKLFIRNDLAELVREGVRLRVLGDYRRFPEDVVALIDDALAQTANNHGPILAIALNYGAQAELVAAAQSLATRAAAGTQGAFHHRLCGERRRRQRDARAGHGSHHQAVRHCCAGGKGEDDVGGSDTLNGHLEPAVAGSQGLS